MQQIALNNKLSLAFDPAGKQVRLVVLENGEEWVCRKEHIKKLEAFLQNQEADIFKGRLQLKKHDHIIELYVKNKAVALVPAEDFRQILNNLQ